jgi:HlyD family secretion protein
MAAIRSGFGRGAWRRVRRAGLASAAAGAALGFVWLVYLGLTWDMRRAEREPPAAWRAVAVERGSLRETVVATGVMEPLARVVVQSEIPGVVASVHADDGDRVARGRPLVELDRSRLEDQAAELRAALAHREALARVDVVGRAEVDLADARRDHERARRLLERGVLSEEVVDDAAHRARLAAIALADAEALRDARLAAAARARSALARVERDLEKSVIRSPVDGVITKRRVEVGAAVADLQNGGTVIAELADDSRIHLLGELDENDVAGVREGQSAEIRVDAFPGELFAGTVRKIASAGAHEGSLSIFEVEIEIEPDPRVRVGMSADARIVVREHANALLVPNAALVRGEDGPRVRVPDPGSDEVRLLEIRELTSDGFRTALAEPEGAAALGEGDTVLVRAGASE